MMCALASHIHTHIHTLMETMQGTNLLVSNQGFNVLLKDISTLTLLVPKRPLYHSTY